LPVTYDISLTYYTVTGAARGLGVKFVEELSARPNSIVFAGVRDVALSPDEDLAKLVAKYPEVVFPIQLRAAHQADSQAAAKIVKDKVGKLDVLIANAGKPSILNQTFYDVSLMIQARVPATPPS
jgi:norsolorinic acid ketoreductase